MHYDVFNGDADGIFSLIQLQCERAQNEQVKNEKTKKTGKNTKLITGVKRDIALLKQVRAENGDSFCVLDISLDKNKEALLNILQKKVDVLYIDHHFSGDIPKHIGLETHINQAPNVCTSLLVNGLLKGKYPLWAIAGAFGDNLKDSAIALAKSIALTTNKTEQLEKLGRYVNYNGYGTSLEDLHFNPEALYKNLLAYQSPLDFIADTKEYQKLEQGYWEDMHKAKKMAAEYETRHTSLFILPNEKWARRVNGVFGNALANQFTHKAHAILTEKDSQHYQVSVRAPLNNKQGADQLCRQFESGGGRAAAAGINELPKENLENFLKAFNSVYSG